ncbi:MULTISPECIES: DUF6215 domain-containing protein [unclassified Kitasatospora]|uniref:DUF6215 domain-containing protein n=1 Tax=unclassified Kitasatospora TaxID=2633591 RepID=UPI0007C85143|nr:MULTISPECIES: DUF6215 domain-containing protein [unclassified Kitasatospora]
MTTDTPSAPVAAAPPGHPSGKGARSAGLQTATAVALAAAVLGGMWGAGLFHPTATDDKPAACNPPKATDAPEYPALCAALNRPDLPTLLGTPDTHVSIAQSGGGPMTFADGTVEYDASAQVQLGTTHVEITDNHLLSVRTATAFASLLPQPTSLLGHPAATYSDHTLALNFNGANTTTGTGGIARHLVVAKGPDINGGSFEITIWRQDRGAPDEAALFRIAAQVFPTLQGWVPGP